MRRATAAALGVASLGAVVAVALVGSDADAQRLDPRRSSVFVVGAPRGPAPMQRVDARRSALARDHLPTGRLRLAWRRTVGLGIEHPALVAADGTVALVASRGDVTFFDTSGEERGQVTVSAGNVGPAGLTSDGTVVFVTGAGDAVGVRRGHPRPRFVTRIGGERSVRAAPLGLADGGIVVATATDLVVLDAEGGVRTRTTLPEPPGAPLLAHGERVVAVSVAGGVYGWIPGREPTRLGAFGGPVDGAPALTESGALVGVVDGAQLVELDLARGTRGARAVAPQGLYLGPVAVRGTAATLLGLTASRIFVVTLDATGQELLRAPVGVASATPLSDGGAGPLVAPPHTGPLVDARGAVAYAAPDGRVGVLGPDGTMDELGELVCSRSGRSAGIAGLTPAGPGALLITCEAGSVALVTGPEADVRR